MNKQQREFIDGLNELTDKTGVVIAGCGCCQSPWLESKGNVMGGYEVDYNEWNKQYGELTWVAAPREKK